MSPIITLDGLSCRTPDGKPLFDNLTFAFGREKAGLVGRNGSGKTTLVRTILGEVAPASGSVTVRGRLGVLRQALAPTPGLRVADLCGLGEDIDRLSRIAAGQGDGDDLSDADWDLEPRLQERFAQLGLPGLDPSTPVERLSGGEATRAALAGLLAAQPDMLVLDEPTNNLDAAGRRLVADTLSGWQGGALVVSHDRDLLRGMDLIVELTSIGVRSYGGGYDLYAARKAEEAEAAERDLQRAQRSVAQVDRDAQAARERQARRDAAGKRFAARGSDPKILLGAMKERAENSGGRADLLAARARSAADDALAEAQSRVERVRRLAFDLPPSGLPSGRLVLSFEDVSFGWPGGSAVLEHVNLRISGPERVALTGPNGSGKSTLIGLAMGQIAPTSGVVARPVPAALLDQRASLLRDDETLAEAYRRLNPAATVNDAHAALARFLFRNTAALKRVGDLSGGERLRAALACILTHGGPQFLILDEPSNHLDLDSLEAVEAALAGYDGALLVVSHDREFLAAVGVDREIELG